MGRGRGGYTQKQIWYLDSGGNKVTDRGAIFVAELYMDMGYESVFRREHTPDKNYDLTIKSSDDLSFIKNIEVKQLVLEVAKWHQIFARDLCSYMMIITLL